MLGGREDGEGRTGAGAGAGEERRDSLPRPGHDSLASSTHSTPRAARRALNVDKINPCLLR